MAERIFLHVATPKSGTTYLQGVLWQNAALLREHGVLLPGRRMVQYAAAKGVTERMRDMRETKADPATAWDQLARQANDWAGDAVVSDELFAPATSKQAARAKSALHDGEVHLVLTARALHRQLPASWQEQVKAGLADSYEEFLASIRSADGVRGRFRRDAGKGPWFWLVQDIPAIAKRWAADIAPENVHVVTVPRSSSDPTALWQRYAAVLGVDGTAFDSAVPKRNVSLGRVEVELLRRVHAAQDPRFTDKRRHKWTRKLLATEVLAQRPAEPIGMPPGMDDWFADRAARMVEGIRKAGFSVTGELSDLDWSTPAESSRPPATATPAELQEAAAWTIGQLREVLRQRSGGQDAGPAVERDDGVPGILELLEHIRAADSDRAPRPGLRSSTRVS